MAVKKEQVTTREGEELWETTAPGRVWYTVVTGNGKEVLRSAGPGAGSKVRIRTEDRERMMDIRDDTPFANGMLRRLDVERTSKLGTPVDPEDPPVDGGPQAMTDDELIEIFNSRFGKAFHGAVDAMNETNVRRMKTLIDTGQVDAKASQASYLHDVIVEKYRGGGTTPTTEDLLASAGTDRVISG